MRGRNNKKSAEPIALGLPRFGQAIHIAKLDGRWITGFCVELCLEVGGAILYRSTPRSRVALFRLLTITTEEECHA